LKNKDCIKLFLLALLLPWICIGCSPTLEVVPLEVEYNKTNATTLKAELEKALRENAFILQELSKTQLEGWNHVTSFVHFSDVQLRDFGVKYMNGKLQRKIADVASGGTQRNEKLDGNDEFPFIALVGAINKEKNIDFAIHTGDSVDTGTDGELLRFISIADSLSVPWFNVIGNHDVFLMGNFTNDNLTVKNPANGVGLLTDRRTFMKAHKTENPITNEKVPESFLHGFDCSVSGCSTSPKSYYSFILSTEPIIRVIVLDTTKDVALVPKIGYFEIPKFGADGYLTHDQFSWLDEQLEEAAKLNQKVLIFGHHPLSQMAGSAPLKGHFPFGGGDVFLATYLTSKPQVLAYFGGHTHRAQIKRYSDYRRGDYDFLEVIAPSMHEFPQVALKIDIYRKYNKIAINIKPIKGIVTTPASVLRSRINIACEGAIEEANLQKDIECWSDDSSTHVSAEVGELSISKKVVPPMAPTLRVRWAPWAPNVKFMVRSIDDIIRIKVNGTIVHEGDITSWVPIKLNEGANKVDIEVFNKESYTGGIRILGGHQREGWNYDVTFKSDGKEWQFAQSSSGEPPSTQFNVWFLVKQFVLTLDSANSLVDLAP
jgi:3',5'-cyclic AMP phosphodiesterase CpdA